MTVLAYLSGHGFGHFTRSEAVLAALAADGEAVHVRTNGKALPLARRAAWAASVEEVDVGPGVVQRGPLAVDPAATRDAVQSHLARWPATVAAEVAAARALGARLVWADVPPLAFEVARRAGVPGLACANFAWSWIYERWAGEDEAFEVIAARLRVAEGLATDLVALPGGGGLDAFGPPRPSLALRRPPTVARGEARDRLRRLAGAPDGAAVVLLSFGGYGAELDLSAAARANPSHHFLAFAAPSSPPPPNLVVLPHDHGLAHQDLVLGADALIGKPGYGTFSECLEGPTPFVVVRMGDGFREHGPLAATIRRLLPSAELSHEELVAGRWGAAIEAARAARPGAAPPRNGLPEAIARARALLAGPG